MKPFWNDTPETQMETDHMSSTRFRIAVPIAALFRAIFVSISAAVLPVLPAPVLAQCDDWIYTPGFHAPFRVVGAYALALYTPPGAAVPRVIVGGQDVYLNGLDIHGIAQWDGTTWSPLGQGVDFTVMDTLVWNSPAGQVLVAGGNFRNAGGQPANYLAAWNGSNWSQVGGGVFELSSGWVAAMTVWDPDGTGPQVQNLVVAGNFDRAGSVDCQNIARWDGTTWRPFGIGLNSWVDALTTWDPDGAGPAFPHLIAAGHFTVANNLIVNHIARWDGVGWRRMGNGLSNDPNRATYAEAVRMKGDTSQNLIGLLEQRLDMVIFRAKFAPTIFAARQIVNHGHILVNGRRCNIASARVKPGDVVELGTKAKEMALVLEAMGLAERDTPEYVAVDGAKATYVRVPTLDEVPYAVKMEPNLVVEFYSR